MSNAEEEDDQKDAQSDAVHAENLEIVLLNVLHQKIDDEKTDGECDDATAEKDHSLVQGQARPAQQVFDQFQKRRADHDRNGEIERKLARGRTVAADQKRREDRDAASGSSRNQAQHLRGSDDQCGLPRKITDVGDLKFFLCVEIFQNDERDAVDDQGDRDGDFVVKIGIQQIVEEQSDHCRGKTGDQNQPPGLPDRFLFFGAFLLAERKQFGEEIQNDRENRPQLNHDQKQFPEFGADVVKAEKTFQNDQMPGAADRKPFADAFDDAVENGDQDIDKIHFPSRNLLTTLFFFPCF